MTKESLARMWDMMRKRHGIALRAIELVPEDRLDSRPIPKMRTPKELVVHWYGMAMKCMVEGALRGRIEELDEATAVAAVRSKADLMRYVHECWNACQLAAQRLTDEQLEALVETPWGNKLRGSYCVGAASDESIHHRAQLLVYLRAMGLEPPDIWDFAHNAPAYQPRVEAPQL